VRLGRLGERPASTAASGLSPDFDRRLEARLGLADAKRRRLSMVRRWRWTAFVFLPIVSAVCWAALPWTFGVGATALIGFVSYLTLILAVASRIDAGFLSYLGLEAVPVVIDVLLLMGVVSWLVWASRPQASA